MYAQNKNKNKKTWNSSNTPDWGMLQSRPFVLQAQMARNLQQPDLRTSLSRAERYGHHIDQIQPGCLVNTTPVQMLSAEEEEKDKLNPDINLNINLVASVINRLKSNHQNQQSEKDRAENQRNRTNSEAKTSISTDKDKKQSSHERLTSPPAIKLSGTEATEEAEPLEPPDPEVERMLTKNQQTQKDSTSAQIPAQKNLIPPPSAYDDKNVARKKLGERNQYLAKKEAMNTLSDSKSFVTIQRAVTKVDGGKSAKSENGKMEDNKQRTKLKNAAEMLREQVIDGDKQVLEQVRGTFNLDPDIVAKQGGERLILQEAQ
ncbi:hypothetical protein [Anabaena subtropica]|uniref:Uncharacterized protein n=1 Tax=Anabaena subtropica FACHB-260 TaxID=2692884 RepID=A0ABR8CNP5_9NOST|nr:hypothetical protein [Anabaena subtropica]MBD2343782.1 hypothetical protein [Anabaena subtropica FACHB-260]